MVTYWGLAMAFATAAMAVEESIPDFGRDVMPILSSNCFSCHGADANKRESKLRLDVRENAVADRDDYHVILPGKAEDSLLMYMITAEDEEDRMPPLEKSPGLSESEINILRQWIDSGAKYESHWAFVPAKRPSPPSVRKSKWVNTPIDQFILARLEVEKFSPAKSASSEVLVRRAYLDLIGLPPSPEDVTDFVTDKSREAWAKLIEKLLASPQYGERWGRHWLDVARYADSGGFETDLFFAHAWRYRDYVIRSFNEDKPFDRFIKEQIAGDELYPDDPDATIATGFYTVGPMLQEADMVTGKLEYDQQTDAVDTTGGAFLGLTMGCARCHDHKYDPVSQRDYFGMQAIFATSDQMDFFPDGRKLRDHAAVKSTFNEFEAEQFRLRALRENDPEIFTKHIRENLEKFVGNNRELLIQVKQTKRYNVLKPAVDRYHRMVEADTSHEPSLAAQYTEIGKRDLADTRKFKNELADLLETTKEDRAERELLELGVISLNLPNYRNGFSEDNLKVSINRLAYDKLSVITEKRSFLVDLGRKELGIQKMDDFIEAFDTLHERLSAKHLNDPNLVPLRILAHRDEPFEVRLLHRGELEKPGDVVTPTLPTQFAKLADLNHTPPDKRRSSLAEWIASEDNLFTARVIVNRVWQWHFGQGLVRTPNDFGIQGERPSHPELLDWLAVEFVEQGWSFKHLHRLIMTSSTYQMGSTHNKATIERDPANILLTRFQPRRFEAEVIWDSLLAVSGKLNPTMFGLPFAPHLNEQELIGNFTKWPLSTPDESYRRAIYLLLKRSFRFPTLSAFDLPGNTESCGRRDITAVPNQALTLLNNDLVQELAGDFADRLLQETDGRPVNVAKRAWLIAYGRPITRSERSSAVEFLGGGKTVTRETLTELCLVLFNTNEFIYFQ